MVPTCIKMNIYGTYLYQNELYSTYLYQNEYMEYLLVVVRIPGFNPDECYRSRYLNNKVS